MNNYPLIKKWLGLEVSEAVIIEHGNSLSETLECDPYVFADELEAKLAEGFKIYSQAGHIFSNGGGKHSSDNFVALAIGKQQIKKQTQSEAALAYLQNLVEYGKNKNLIDSCEFKRAKEILEMKE